MALLDLQDLSVAYGDQRPVIKGFHLALESGDRLGIAGASGCGKTTLLRAVTGLLPSSVKISGRVHGSARIGFIPQESSASLSPFLTAGRQVRELAGSWQETEELFRGAGLAEDRYLSAYPHQLSGGERQRVLIAQALALRPNLIIADEPTSNLDRENEDRVLSMLDRYAKQSGAAVLIASHRERVFEALGCLVMHLTPPARPLQLSPQSVPPVLPLLRVQGVSKTYVQRGWLLSRRSSKRALEEISLEIGTGEMVILTGPSGSGKSTLARLLCGREWSESGSIEWSLPGPAPDRVQLVPQEPSESLNPNQTVEAALREACGQSIKHLLPQMDLPEEWAERPIRALSEGQRARVAILRCVAALKKGLLILDESLAGLDRATRNSILRFLRAAQTRGLSILLITHDLEAVEQVASRVIRLESGRLAA